MNKTFSNLTLTSASENMKEKKSILLIDDDQDDQELFEEAINEIDPTLQCKVASSAMEAMKLLEQDNPPDFVFLDLNLPCINGKQFLKYIRQHKSFKKITVVVYTTSKLDDDVNETKKIGAQHFLTKPKYFSQLKKAIELIVLSNPDIKEFDMDEYITMS
jgi:CheY-like chemotaxis protein